MQTHTAHVASTPPVRVAFDPVIPAVRGEFYAYSSLFTSDRPVGFLMKCRANKGRPITDVANYSQEHDLTFVFAGGVSVCSPNAAPSIRLLGGLISADDLNETSITARADISQDAFYALRQRRNGGELAAVCCQAEPRNKAVVALSAGTILAVITQSGKYGLLLVKELTPTSLRVDAAHILL
jgi:hypothetical protein